MQFSKE